MTRKLTFLILAMMFAILGPSAKAWGESYTITFSVGSGDGTAASTDTPCSSIVSAGSDYLSGNLATATKVYYSGGSGLKLGASSNAGTIKMNLTSAGQVTPTSIVVNAKLYNSGKATTLKVNGSETQNLTANFADYTFYITSNITYLELVTSKYAWISSITVNYEGSTATLDHIGIKTAPTKVVYTEGEYFDPTGLVITKYFDDETTSDLAYAGNETAFSFNPTLTTPLATTDTQVEITVGGKSANQAITVNVAPKYTITFMDRTSQVDQRGINQGAAVGVLPEDPDDIGTYKFQGWAEQFEGTVQNAPDFVTSATVPTSDMTYYAVYAEVSGSGESTTESSTIEAIAIANSWSNSLAYTNASFGNITVTGSGTGNNCKYYESDETWRFYTNGNGAVTITAPEYISNITLTGTITFSTPDGWNYSNDQYTPNSGTSSKSITINATGSARIQSISVTYVSAATYSNYTQNPVAKALVSIEVSGTPAEFWKGDAFNHNGMTVTANWDDESQTDVTADCEFSTPDMTTAGEKEITVTYQEQSDTYTINVQTIANTLEEPYTVAQAIAIIDAGKDLNSEVYVAGTISQLDGGNNAPEYHNLTYWIADESSETKFEVYRGRNLGDTDFNTNNDILIGADVIVYGKITKFQTTYEFSQGNYLVSYTAPEVEKYNINLNQNDYGTISADVTAASEGQTVTLTATPIANYHFFKWTVLDGEANEVSVTNNQFTMPASDVEVEATFEEDESVVFTYHYNGDFYNDGIDYKGTIITLEEDPDMSPVGFSFVGWSTSVASTNVIEGTTYTLNEDVDFYAVFEKTNSSRENGEESFVKVTEAPEDWSGEYLLVYEGGENTSHDIFPAVAWTGVDAGGCGAEVSITSNTIAGKPEAAATLTIAPMEGDYSIMVNGGDNNGKYISGQEKDNNLLFNESAQPNTLNITDGSVIITSNTSVMRYNYASNGLRFRYYKSSGYTSQQPVQLYKKSGSTSGTIGRYTRVYDGIYTFEGTDLTVEGPSIVVNGYTLNVSGEMTNTNPANLVIEDGAQLIHHNAGVTATVQKNITGYGEDNVQTRDGYYLIANPTANALGEEDEYDALDGCAQFDLYTFDPTAAFEWINLGNTSQRVTFERNVGYLFAVPSDRTMSFRGSLLPAGETEITLVRATEGDGIDFPGFNLIGNPYACNAYVEGYNFYRMVDGELQTAVTSATVAPCEGFFVEATATGQSVSLSTTAPEAPASLLNITVSQNRGNVIDRAIVNFNGSNNLHKFMMNPQHTNLSIAKGGETFAAISTEAEGELPVNFKAEKNGTYTITVNTENVDAEYLHLIDNMTGMDTDLLSTPSYTFDAKTSDYASRFKLVFGVKNDNEEMSQASSFAYINNGEIVISNEGRATLQVIDVLGRIVSSEEINGECRISTNGLTAGLYILNLNGMTQKIVVR